MKRVMITTKSGQTTETELAEDSDKLADIMNFSLIGIPTERGIVIINRSDIIEVEVIDLIK